jgi:hypothetical protein
VSGTAESGYHEKESAWLYQVAAAAWSIGKLLGASLG